MEIVQAYQVADYFMMQDLKKQIACTREERLAKSIRLMQLCAANEPSETRPLSDSVRKFIGCLFAAIHATCNSQHPDGVLHRHFLEFGIRTRHILMRYSVFTEGLLDVPHFATELFIEYEKGLRYEYPGERIKCAKCSKSILANGVHLARPVQSGGGSDCVCSKCFKKENGEIYPEQSV